MLKIKQVLESSRRYKLLLVVLLSVVTTGVVAQVKVVDAFSGAGDGSSQWPFRVATCQQLQEIANNPTANYALTADIDCTDTTNWNSGQGFAPINDFTATLDGRNHVINGLTVNRAGNHSGNAALFNSTSGATVRSLLLTNVSVTYSSGEFISSLIGHMNGGVTEDVSVQGTVTGVAEVGGLVANAENSAVIRRTSFTGTVVNSGAWTGGLVGFLSNSILDDSYVNANVSGGNSGGGLVGSVSNSNGYTRVTNSYTTGKYQDANYRSALIGFTATYSGTPVIVWNLFTTMMPTFDGTNPSGAAAIARDTTSATIPVDVAAIQFDATKTGSSTNCVEGTMPSACSAVNSNGLDADYFKGNSSVSPFNNWDFESVWQVQSGNYPSLIMPAATLLSPFAAPGAPTDVVAVDLIQIQLGLPGAHQGQQEEVRLQIILSIGELLVIPSGQAQL